MNDNPLEAILTYDMNELEARAFKLALMWDALSRKEFPDYKHPKMSRKGDPRKSTLFKYAYKLANETNGLLLDKEYRLYILAQLHVLKGCTDGKVHALLGPQCLVGEKAWVRWRMWKNKYDKQVAVKSQSEDILHVAPIQKLKSEIDQTKAFLAKTFGQDDPTPENIKKSLDDRRMIKWITLGRVTPYYALLSPFIKRAIGAEGIEEKFVFDLSVYKPYMTDEVRKHFRQVFNNEYEAA